ncbi:MAG TPA: glycosyltransferase [Solirubrobacteraceae bacterium]|nr:glycosyltransferase [Solirubrobacteraceae bacterium]
MTSNTGAGHIGPMVPFAHAFLRAGHDVLLAAPAKAHPTVARAGVPFLPLADPPSEETDAVFASLAGLPQEEQSVRVMREIFAGIDARTSLPDVLRAVGQFRPDVLLREPTEYAGLLAAERLGVRHGRIAIMAAGTETWGVPVVAPVLDEHRARLGLRPDPDGRRITESAYLTILPEALEDPDDFGPAHAIRFREHRADPSPLPYSWSHEDRPLVYVTYGSVTPTMPYFPALFRDTVAALGELPVRALFTVGVEVDVEALGPVPGNVRIARWIPQADVMPHAAAMVGHGGAGSTRIALAAGVPSVVVPGFADQFRNAERVAALGAGLEATAADLVSALRQVLGEPSYREAAARVAAEVARLPLVDEAPGVLGDWLEGERAAA